MIYDISNVASNTQIIEEFTDIGLSDVVSIDTDADCIYVYDSPTKWCYVTGEIDTSKIRCDWIDVYRNESGVPNKFIFKRLKDAQP